MLLGWFCCYLPLVCVSSTAVIPVISCLFASFMRVGLSGRRCLVFSIFEYACVCIVCVIAGWAFI
ncbi:hypothetical protein BGX38DRAFT_1217167 [Terfezia claveryi]|nr:hypothetical protein BGX38DRAFT_1217167 [Terfezia claveryi]